MIAYHVPPAVGSGVQRLAAFVKHLPRCGWRPVVLAPSVRAYPQTAADPVFDAHLVAPVQRSFAVDSARHLAVRGRYPTLLAIPDRWVSWCPSAVIAGLKTIRKERAAVIFSTYPIATAHLIGYFLHRLTGLPWVADFRDPMAQVDYPENPLVWRSFRWIEQCVVRRAAKAVFTTAGCLHEYRARFVALDAGRCVLIANGYDEDVFLAVGGDRRGGTRPDRPLQLLHSGLIYPWERDPRSFFEACAALKAEGFFAGYSVKVTLRGSGSERLYRDMIDALQIADVVTLEPHLPYRDAIAEMSRADGLLLLQAANSNHQIPAKAYEYLRAGKPVFPVVDPAGETAGLLRSLGITTFARLQDATDIRNKFREFVTRLRTNTWPVPSAAQIREYSRERTTEILARTLNECVHGGARPSGRQGRDA